MTARDQLGVMIVCNHPDNGANTGVCRVVCIVQDDELISIEGDPIRCRLDGSMFRFGPLWLYQYGYRYWGGNWEVVLSLEDAARLLEYARREHWTIEVGETRLFDAWQTGEPLLPVLRAVTT